MTQAQLASTIEATKGVVLRAVQRHLNRDLAHLVEDIAQETYLRYYLKFQKGAQLPQEEQERWLYVVARNQCRNAARKARRESHAHLRLVQEQERDMDPGFDLEPTPQTVTWDIGQARLHAAELPEPYREVTLLRLSGLNMKAIALQLGLRSGTVKSRLYRGREMLSRVLNSAARREEKS
ncbi:MAG: sigma-70 family RNA polymerase sigma factor [Spirochaetia bacterium]|nr:sigma-70 family RNA polymerase sigma factor [Spirochaetia bacterium]